MQRKVMAALAAALAMALAMALPPAAHAALITFDLTGGSGSVHGGLDFNAGGRTVSVTAQKGSYSSSTDTLVVPWSTISGPGTGIYSASNGLGVLSSASGDSSSLDGGGSNSYGSDPDEALLFSFDQQVSLVSVGFSGIDNSDDFALDVDGTNQFVDRLLETSFTATAFGSSFRIWTDSDNDSFKVASITIDTGSLQLRQLSQLSSGTVGEPRAAATFVVGLVALGFGLHRRRRR